MGTVRKRSGDTKERILVKSLDLFASKGFRETTVRDIASSVGLQQGALYNHFKNKDAILTALIDQLMSSAIVTIFEEKQPGELYKRGKALLANIATTFKLLSFDGKNEALFKLMMQEMYKNGEIRDLYHEYFYQHNIKKLSSVLFLMMQDDMIRSYDPLMLANEFLSPLFFYQTQVILLKLDQKSTSAAVTLFEKHVDYFWDSIRTQDKVENQSNMNKEKQ
jgi:AcrR family transcriptional regulator